jgi:hypothetical protein
MYHSLLVATVFIVEAEALLLIGPDSKLAELTG